MDYIELAKELLEKGHETRKIGPNRIFEKSTRGEIFAIFYIHHHGTLVSPGDISDAMEISSARVAVMLNNMEKKGLIKREQDQKDKRKIAIHLTEKGIDYAEVSLEKVISSLAKTLEDLGEVDAVNFVRIVGKLGSTTSDS